MDGWMGGEWVDRWVNEMHTCMSIIITALDLHHELIVSTWNTLQTTMWY